MKLRLYFIILCLCSFSSFSQTIKLTVVDIDNIPLANVLIVDSGKNTIDETNENGVVVIDKSKHIIGLVKKGFEDRWLKISDSDQKEVVIVMDYYYKEFDVVNVEQARPEEALSIDAVNILDYFPFNESILTLKRFRGTYYISVDSIGNEGKRHEFTRDRPKQFFMDCIGNMHVICAEKVYQIAISNDELVVIDEISKTTFDILLEPCVAKFDEKYVMKSLSFGNQAYSLALYDKVKDPEMFYYQIDVLSARVAAEEELKMEFSVRSDVLNDSMEAHILELRRFVRELYAGQNPDVNLAFIMNDIQDSEGNTKKWTEQMALYKLFTYPIDIRSFRVGNNVAVVDYEVDSLSIFNDKGKRLNQVPFNVEGDIKQVWQDVSNDNIYFYTRNHGNYMIYYLNDETGETVFLNTTRDLGFTKNHRIHSGYLYYLKVENNYHKIHRVQLPKHTS